MLIVWAGLGRAGSLCSRIRGGLVFEGSVALVMLLSVAPYPERSPCRGEIIGSLLFFSLKSWCVQGCIWGPGYEAAPLHLSGQCCVSVLQPHLMLRWLLLYPQYVSKGSYEPGMGFSCGRNLQSLPRDLLLLFEDCPPPWGLSSLGTILFLRDHSSPGQATVQKRT